MPRLHEQAEEEEEEDLEEDAPQQQHHRDDDEEEEAPSREYSHRDYNHQPRQAESGRLQQAAAPVPYASSQSSISDNEAEMPGSVMAASEDSQSHQGLGSTTQQEREDARMGFSGLKTGTVDWLLPKPHYTNLLVTQTCILAPGV